MQFANSLEAISASLLFSLFPEISHFPSASLSLYLYVVYDERALVFGIYGMIPLRYLTISRFDCSHA